MRLLHCTQTLEDGHISVSFEEYEGYIPEYAILSHRWGPTEDEVSFNDIKSGSAVSKRGYDKVHNCCAQALEDDFHYVWIDSCCIDKSSSAELTEAINSMYRYYANAAVCYAYLEDVQDKEDPHNRCSSFRKSAWFRRGWTLQELIAPDAVLFLSKGWIEMGTKDTLADLVENITGIKRKYFTGEPISYASIAQRMSWAANRETTRVEDRAYSLMGLFGVHMPAIYGEGRKAFIRLQLEILKTSDDQTIFAWDDRRLSSDSGMLADDPWHFRKGSTIKRLRQHGMIRKFDHPDPGTTPFRLHYELTNFGLHIWLPVQHRFIADTQTPVLQAALACGDTSSPSPRTPIQIVLAPIQGRTPVTLYPTQGSTAVTRYTRIDGNTDLEPEVTSSQGFRYQELFIEGFIDDLHFQPSYADHSDKCFEVDFRALKGFDLFDCHPPTASPMQSSLIIPVGYEGFTVQFWNRLTTEMIVVQGQYSYLGGSWLDMRVTTSSQPRRMAEDFHGSYQECLGISQRLPANLWFHQMDLPVSKSMVILSANLLKYRPRPGEPIDLNCSKRIRVKLKVV